jgi:hypothetical protein
MCGNIDHKPQSSKATPAVEPSGQVIWHLYSFFRNAERELARLQEEHTLMIKDHVFHEVLGHCIRAFCTCQVDERPHATFEYAKMVA